jgi:hypothetical protein
LKRQARTEEKRLEEIYEAGRTEGRSQRKPTTGTRPKARRRKSTAVRALAGPVRAQLRSGTQLLTMTFGLLALYLVLNSAPQVSGALNGLVRAYEWLARPDTTVL